MNRSVLTASLHCVALAGALLLPCIAGAQEYRRITTIDGRVLIAEMVGSDGTGFDLQVPAGSIRLPFAELAGMDNIDAALYQTQPDWPVWIASTASAREGFVGAVRAVEGVAVIGVDDTRIPAEVIATAQACDLNLQCATDALAPYAPVWVLRTTLLGTEAVFETNIAGTEYTNVVRADRAQPQQVGRAVYDALGLIPPEGAVVQIPDEPAIGTTVPTPPVAVVPPRTGDVILTPPPTQRAWTRQRVLASSFIPLPGYTAFAQGDAAGGALAIATVVPVTAAWVGVAGKNAQTSGEHIALSAGGYYLATVVANQVFGLRARNRDVAAAVVPVSQGAVLSVGGSL